MSMLPSLELLIYVFNPGGFYIGVIQTGFNWVNHERLDRAGDFSFQMPAADPTASYLEFHNVIIASWFDGVAWRDLGKGIIDDIRVVGSAAPTILTVSGGDLLRELAWRSVGELKLGRPTNPSIVATGVESLQPTDVHVIHVDVAGGGVGYGDYIVGQVPVPGGLPVPFVGGVSVPAGWPYSYVDGSNTYDGLLATKLVIQIGSWHFWYICYDDPYVAVSWFLSNVNGTTGSWRVQYYNGTDWIDFTGVVDGTMVAGKTLGQNGTISWDLPIDWVPLEQSICPAPGNPYNPADYVNLTGFWTRWLPQAFPADGTGASQVDVQEITIAGLVPTTQAVALILGIANGLGNAYADPLGVLHGTPLPSLPPSLGWSLDVAQGLAGTLATDVFGVIQDDTVLAALIKLSELTNEHFRLGNGTQLVWLGKNTPSSGIRALRPWGP